MYPYQSQTPIHRYFAGLTEQTFETRLGVADPALVDYIAGLLTRFVRSDAIYNVRSLAGKRLDQVAQMLIEADARIGRSRREVHRHIGDFTLFWTGVYPEALGKIQDKHRPDHLLEYRVEGKRAYFIASTLCDGEADEESEIYERLSHEFEMCQYGLSEVRREWERRDADGGELPKLLLD